MTEEKYQRKDNHYVDKEKFYNALVEHRAKLRASVLAGSAAPRVSEYIGECLLKIANGLSRKYNFNGYSFRDEMVSEGIIKCLQSVDKFDPAKSTQAFSYFTQICYYEFIHRILVERNQKRIKVAFIQNMDLDQLVDSSDPEQGQQMLDYIKGMLDSDAAQQETTKKKKRKAGLEDLM